MNRKERRTLSVKQRRGEVPLTPASLVSIEEQVAELVNGKSTTSNPTLKYLAGRYRDVRDEMQAVGRAAGEMDERLRSVRRRISELAGQMEGYTKDMKIWIEKETGSASPDKFDDPGLPSKVEQPVPLRESTNPDDSV